MAKQNLDELIEESEDAIAKGDDLSNIEAEHHHKVKSENRNSKSEKIEEKIKEKKFKETKTEDVAENVNENKKDKPEKIEDKKEKPRKVKKGKSKIRSKKYLTSRDLIDSKKKYEINDAIELAKKSSFSKFAGNIEIHIRLLGKSGKPENLRGLIKYPHSTGKKISIVILDEKNIEEILKTSKAPADIYLSSPELMPKVGKLAKILGPKGKMPNPKAGTVTSDPEKTKLDMEAGQSEYKTDSYGIIHQVIGKVSIKSDELIANFSELISVLPKDKISSINLCATMAPAVKVQK